MKTPEENKCGMECIRTNADRSCVKPEKGQCPRCKQLVDESLAYIQQLESRLAQVERERDAAVKIIEDATTYLEDFGSVKFALMQLKKWRGVCPENTKEDSK